MTIRSKGRYTFASLGCPKNLVDSERMLGLLQLDGYELVHDVEDADFAIVNTCGFIEQARDESFAVIDEMLAHKEAGSIRGLIVSGCLAERDKESLLVDRPGIDHLVGVFGREAVTQVADRLIGRLDEQRNVFQPAPSRPLDDRNRFRVTPRHFAYLKISEGCDRLCTFCAIPKMRGKHASKPMEVVLQEARELAADGVRELIIVAQDTTYYGMDLYGESRLVELLRALDQVEGIEWIRLMYFYPEHVSDELIDTIAGAAHILPYIDLPLQHINNRVLRRMQRRVNRARTEQLLDRLQQGIPNLALRTTFITGFPGETDAEFDELATFIENRRFDRLGVFTYSLEPDTPAAKLDGHFGEEVKTARRDKLMRIQQGVAFEQANDLIGEVLDVLIDFPVDGESNAWIGRTARDAPDVDSVVYVSGESVEPGRIVPCEMVARQDYDLIGAVCRPVLA